MASPPRRCQQPGKRRPPRPIVEGATYFVTRRVKPGSDFQLADRFAAVLLETMDACRREYGFLVHGYVIMPEHFHAVIRPGVEADISLAMQEIARRSALRFNRIQGRRGRVYQRRFYDHVVRRDESLRGILRYIHDNPVRAGLATDPGEWPWSSWRDYHVRDYAGPVEIDRT